MVGMSSHETCMNDAARVVDLRHKSIGITLLARVI